LQSVVWPAKWSKVPFLAGDYTTQTSAKNSFDDGRIFASHQTFNGCFAILLCLSGIVKGAFGAVSL
jgi:hypothetical protein